MSVYKNFVSIIHKGLKRSTVSDLLCYLCMCTSSTTLEQKQNPNYYTPLHAYSTLKKQHHNFQVDDHYRSQDSAPLSLKTKRRLTSASCSLSEYSSSLLVYSIPSTSCSSVFSSSIWLSADSQRSFVSPS